MNSRSAHVTSEVLVFDDAAGWDAWLAAHHDSADGAVLRIARKGAPGLTIHAALEVALCHGWIDSVRRRGDDQHFLQRYSPRRKGSPWSAVNVALVEELTAAGRMRPGGLAEVAAAKADGRWDAAYASQATATVPGDLRAALDADGAARAAFDALTKSGRYAILLTLMKARTPAARAKALDKALAGLRAADLR
ncbi:OmdA domain containing protein [Jiangella aurantiaca]|uniref:OmdA domain containing protein n=1 Tax=Jiangella aurantiaca TaxID=2530373 RepID=A0A4R5A841_9ACTN|nr:YdeI/OmpD-associated family protein [Jiangella aurantiaca]TDD68313.1 OmdA domain containing protein [Jiangella aurantiaca]